MDVAIFSMFIPIISLVGIFITIVYVRRFENLERMAIIEKGLSPDIFRRKHMTSGALRASLLMIGIGLGLLVGYALDKTFDMEEIAYFSMIFILGGLGLGVAYVIEEKKAR